MGSSRLRLDIRALQKILVQHQNPSQLAGTISWIVPKRRALLVHNSCRAFPNICPQMLPHIPRRAAGKGSAIISDLDTESIGKHTNLRFLRHVIHHHNLLFGVFCVQVTQPEIPAQVHRLHRWAKGLGISSTEGGPKTTIALEHVQHLRDMKKEKAERPAKRHKHHQEAESQSQVTLGVFFASHVHIYTPQEVPDGEMFTDVAQGIVGTLMHPLHPTPDGVAQWEQLPGTKSQRAQIARMGIDAQTAEELFIQYGAGSLRSR